MYRFLINKKYDRLFRVMNSQKERNIAQLARLCDMTPTHLTIVMKQFESENIIIKNKSGREFEVELTEKGMEIVKALNKLRDLEKIKSQEVKNE
jgi:predicted transcriptional regulator